LSYSDNDIAVGVSVLLSNYLLHYICLCSRLFTISCTITKYYNVKLGLTLRVGARLTLSLTLSLTAMLLSE